MLTTVPGLPTTRPAVPQSAGSPARAARGMRSALLLVGLGACSGEPTEPTFPVSWDHAASTTIIMSTTHHGDAGGLDGQIVTDDLIAGMHAEQLPGDLGWASWIEADTLLVPTDGVRGLSSRYGLLNNSPGSGTPVKRLRYQLTGPSDITAIRVLTGHPFDGSGDARVFSTFVIRYSTDGGVTYHLLGYFQSDPSGTQNTATWQATLVEVYDSQASVMIAGATHLEFDLFAVGAAGVMEDPYTGGNPYTGVDDGLPAAVASPYLWEIDVLGSPGASNNQAPIASAGADQQVASGAAVTLDGSGSSDPDADALTYAWTQTSGTAVALINADQDVASFTAGSVTETLGFELTVCDPEPLCDTDAVTITVTAPITDVLDLAAEVSVSGPVKSNGTEKDFVVVVTNAGTLPATITSADLSGTVSIGGGAVGTVSAADGSKTLAPGRSTRFKLTWSYPPGAFARGDNLVFEVCIVAAGDGNSANDCGTLTVQGR